MTPDGPASDGRRALWRYWQPRYWHVWLIFGLLRVLVLLPLRALQALGRGLGRLLYHALPRRRRVAATNLALCFPELDEAQRQRLLDAHFASLGMAAFELALALWAGEGRIRRILDLNGIEHLTEALQDGHGVVLLSGHFASLELSGRVFRHHVDDFAALYRANENPLIDGILHAGRIKSADELITKDNVRQMIRALRRGAVVWYAPDQAYDRKNSVEVPFFGEPAMTNAALTQIARIGKARVVPYFPIRLPGAAGYRLDILPALEDFPTGDMAEDARRINELLEERIRLAPEQYYWVHRRFKRRPGRDDPY